MEEVNIHCETMVSRAKREKQKKADHNLKSAISNSRWERMVRPDTVVDMSGGKLTKTERQVLSLGLKFATGLNDRTPLYVATAATKFRSQRLIFCHYTQDVIYDSVAGAPIGLLTFYPNIWASYQMHTWRAQDIFKRG